MLGRLIAPGAIIRSNEEVSPPAKNEITHLASRNSVRPPPLRNTFDQPQRADGHDLLQTILLSYGNKFSNNILYVTCCHLLSTSAPLTYLYLGTLAGDEFLKRRKVNHSLATYNLQYNSMRMCCLRCAVANMISSLRIFRNSVYLSKLGSNVRIIQLRGKGH